MWGRMAWAAELMKRARQEGRPAARSLTTQFVVGAVGESDRELLETVQRAHRELGLRRAYFSAFHPIERSPTCRNLKPLALLLVGQHPMCCLMADARRSSFGYGSQIDSHKESRAGLGLPDERGAKQDDLT